MRKTTLSVVAAAGLCFAAGPGPATAQTPVTPTYSYPAAARRSYYTYATPGAYAAPAPARGRRFFTFHRPASRHTPSTYHEYGTGRNILMFKPWLPQ